MKEARIVMVVALMVLLAACGTAPKKADLRSAPLRTFLDADGNECREYTHVVTIGGRQETGEGITCRQRDGSWVVQGK